ncbi:NUDIX domain-containing protein [Kitasatospora sp. NPDC096128]|uniref:NUDIX domain-containing protein n=1 Tax=Kitasatospora sp. NPDC096128 TaxID=3155547 RepID=UPI00331EFFCB
MNTRPGIDTPDHRGRTGLDQAGRDLHRNPDVVVRDVELTSQGWHVLRRTTFDHRRRDGRWTTQQRETYDRGNGAVVLPYDAERGRVLLTRQFRYPAYVNDHPDGMLIEAAAGLLDGDDPLAAIRRESTEELGVTLGPLTHILDAYMSPGSVTERLHFYAAPYTPADRTGEGGGLEEDGEDIEVLELPFTDALAMIRDGRIADGKTIVLLQWAALDGPFAATAGTHRYQCSAG